MSWELKEYERSAYTIFEIIDESGETIEKIVADEKDYAEKKKKAQLMAAAPELLEKLINLQDKLYKTPLKGVVGDHRISNITYSDEEIKNITKLINEVEGADYNIK